MKTLYQRITAGTNSFKKEWNKTTHATVNRFESSFGPVYVTLYYYPGEDAVHIRKLENIGAKGKGYASKALEHIISLADKHKMTLTLDPSPYGTKSLTKKDLKNWYGRYGFKKGSTYWTRKPR